MHLKQPGFTYSVCGLFTKNKERIQNTNKTGNTRYIYKNELDKTFFQLDMAYGDSKDLARRRASDKVLRDKAFNIAKNRKYNVYERDLASMADKVFERNLKLVVLIMKSNKMSNWLKNCKNKLLENLKKNNLFVI